MAHRYGPTHHDVIISYNLQVVQGLMRADPKSTTEPPHLIALWLHEAARVFADRLTTDDDAAWFRARQEALLAREFGVTWGEVAGGGRLLYGDYLVPGAEPRVSERGGPVTRPASCQASHTAAKANEAKQYLTPLLGYAPPGVHARHR